jgi:hypothetical protein
MLDLVSLQPGATIELTLNASLANSWSVISATASGIAVLSCNQAITPAPLSVYASLDLQGGLVWATQATISDVPKVWTVDAFRVQSMKQTHEHT